MVLINLNFISAAASLSLSITTSSARRNISWKHFFEFSVNVTCSGGACGDVNVTLKPLIIPKAIFTESKFEYCQCKFYWRKSR